MSASFIYFTYKEIKNGISLTITNDAIIINKKRHLLSSIKSVDFTGLKKTNSFRYEGMKIVFSNGACAIFPDYCHKNFAELKCFLESRLIQNPDESLAPVNRNFSFEIFRGGFFGPSSCFVYALIITAFTFLFYNNIISIFCLILALIYLIFQFHYIQLDGNEITVKKIAIPWYKKAFDANNIREIVLTSGSRTPYGFYIIAKDYKKSRIYFAASFYDKDWQKLKESIEFSGIIVRDEIGVGKND